METETDIVKNITQDFKNLLYAAIPEDVKERAEDHSPPRKRGGQPTNQNARKHGFYSKALTPDQEDDFPEAMKERYLDKEIAVMRLKITALMADPEVDFNLVVRAMGTLGRLRRIEDRIRYGM